MKKHIIFFNLITLLFVTPMFAGEKPQQLSSRDKYVVAGTLCCISVTTCYANSLVAPSLVACMCPGNPGGLPVAHACLGCSEFTYCALQTANVLYTQQPKASSIPTTDAFTKKKTN